ncbi:MAG: hypothetical protein JXQ72_10775 [Anaerolineae bacterium]|nr:hypothetical protein [Anaerolineae bacterium]
MSNRKTRLSSSLLLVAFSLLIVNLACYSGQVPGLFELTPYYTPTPLNEVENARFAVLEEVLAPQEPGRAFFNLTLDPEPLDPSLLNSKAMCEGDSPAQVLYSGIGGEGKIYYLVDCVGSVGWVEEYRLAGPLNFAKDELAIAVIPSGAMSIEIMDDFFNPMPFNPMLICQPETIVTVRELQAVDLSGDGTKEVVYNIACPTASGDDLIGWVTNDVLVGPVQINVNERALALSSADSDVFRLASEAAPVTDDNVIEGECVPGSILEAKSVKLVDDTVFYKVICGDVEGWTEQARLVGPLQYNVDDYTLIHVPPVHVFADELPVDDGVSDGSDTTETTEPDADAPAIDPTERKVVQYVPPLYLTDSPGEAILIGDEANVVGQCATHTITQVQEYAGFDKVYYRIACDECVATETDADGIETCTATERREGWTPQRYLLGPLVFVPGERLMYKSDSPQIDPDIETPTWVRLPTTTTGATIIGRFTQFNGRCLLEDGVEVVDVVLEQSLTTGMYSFLYQVQCTGQRATYDESGGAGDARPVTYHEDELVTITGYAAVDDLERIEE